MKKSLLHVGLALCLAAAMAAGQAGAAEAAAPAASAASAPAPVTLSTACGAGGTGDAMRYTVESPSRRVPVRETRQASKAQPGELASLVNGAGVWEACRMPPKPKDCPTQPVLAEWVGQGGRKCVSPPGAVLSGRNISPAKVTKFSADYFRANPLLGQRRGWVVYQCRKEGWVLLRQHCQ